MSYKETTLLWIKDLLEQLSSTGKQLSWIEDKEVFGVIQEKMIRDLEQCKRLCESMRNPSRVLQDAS